ncbi:MAG: PqqD family protein [Lachnospiraceae bacterium]|nr:PqqD family protein [Lachnospiraceae bacterium]
MKAKSGFVLREVVGEYILMPVGENIGHFNGTIIMNDVAALVWKKLQNPVSRDDLLAAILDEFSIWEDVAAADLDKLLEKLKNYGVIEED